MAAVSTLSPPGQYSYTPIDSETGDIRLVCIYPGVGNLINCKMVQSSLQNENVAYEALSYVWGDASQTGEILLDGHPFNVTRNLRDALLQLRLTTPRKLWIDAICVNQQDLVERSKQVLLMRDIYHGASRVVVWLGNSTSESKLAFKAVREYLAIWNPEFDLSNTQRNIAERNLRQRLVCESDGQYELQCFFVDVMMRDWWSRIWVIQEVAVASEVLMKCGHEELSLDEFERAAEFLMARMGRAGTRGFTRMANIREVMKIRGFSRAKSPLMIGDLVARNRRCQATDPRDMVYAVLGLSTDGEDERLRPDYSEYSKTVTVYARLVEHTIMHGKDLDIIFVRAPDLSKSDWPSWVPDWSTTSMPIIRDDKVLQEAQDPSSSVKWHAASLIAKFSSYRDGATYPQANQEWGASEGSSFFASIDVTSQILMVKGIIVDQIYGVGCTGEENKGWTSCKFGSWESLMLRHFGNSQSDVKGFGTVSLLDVFDRVNQYVRESDSKSSPPPAMAPVFPMVRRLLPRWRLGRQHPSRGSAYIGGGDIVQAYLRTLLTDHNWNGMRSTDEDYQAFWAGAIPSSYRNTTDLLQYRYFLYDILTMYTWCRRFLVSRKGYIGLAPSSSMTGDLVCVLFGCSVPVILRKVRDHFRVVGEAYVHGLMDGQAIKSLAKGELIEQEFLLR